MRWESERAISTPEEIAAFDKRKAEDDARWEAGRPAREAAAAKRDALIALDVGAMQYASLRYNAFKAEILGTQLNVLKELKKSVPMLETFHVGCVSSGFNDGDAEYLMYGSCIDWERFNHEIDVNKPAPYFVSLEEAEEEAGGRFMNNTIGYEYYEYSGWNYSEEFYLSVFNRSGQELDDLMELWCIVDRQCEELCQYLGMEAGDGVDFKV